MQLCQSLKSVVAAIHETWWGKDNENEASIVNGRLNCNKILVCHYGVKYLLPWLLGREDNAKVSEREKGKEREKQEILYSTRNNRYIQALQAAVYKKNEKKKILENK